MPINGFAAGKRLWIQIHFGTLRADYVGVVLYVTEAASGYRVQLEGGFSVSFSEDDLREGRVTALHFPVPHGEKKEK